MENKRKLLGWNTVYVVILVVVFFCNSACSRSQESVLTSKDIINSISKREKAGNQKMSQQVLMESLVNIDLESLSSSEALKEAVLMDLPMSSIEGVALRIMSPIDIVEHKDAAVVVLIGISAETNAKTPLAEHARIVLTNKESSKTSEVLLFQAPSHKIPMPEDKMPPPPVNAVEPVHSYTVEVFYIRERLKVEWVPSTYAIQVIVGEMTSNTVDFKYR